MIRPAAHQNAKRLAIVVPSLKIGGMERVSVVLANEFARRAEYEVHLVALSNDGVAFEVNGAVHLHLPPFSTSKLSFPVAVIRALRFLTGFCRDVRPALILSLGDRYNGFCIVAARACGIPILVSSRMSPLKSSGTAIDWANWVLYRLAGGLIVQTETARRVLARRFKATPIHVVPNPFNIPSQVDCSYREPVILNVGRFADQKNQHLLVRYFGTLDAKGWTLRFLGDGPKHQLFERERLALSDRSQVDAPGFVHDVDSHYRRAAIFAFTSTSEGFPNALAEAMMHGCACIAFDCVAGPSDLIEDGVNGFLVANLDHADYMRKLRRLIEDPALRKRFGRAAAQSMQRYRADAIAGRLNEVFGEIEN
jgi:GalNAc-alpha-(1->4)-GalNAc-alpha-(1->3)-diNAcBac-PP-undecaprenol alpha-1,4-N-acetyl-D-galactosaminyltransferase